MVIFQLNKRERETLTIGAFGHATRYIYYSSHTEKAKLQGTRQKNKRRKDEDKNSPLHNDVESQSFR